MRRFLLIILATAVVALGVTAWQLPNIIRAIPSRYVEAYFPEALKEIGARDQIERLPTAAAPVDVSALLPTETPLPPPPTQTTVPTITPTPEPNATAVPSPTPAPPTPTAIPFPEAARLPNIVTHQFQGWNNCGPATLAMGLSHFGVTHFQYDTAQVLKPNPEDRNVTPQEMAAYVNSETELNAIYRQNGNMADLRRLIAAGVPVIVETGIDPPGAYSWLEWYGHYFLVVGYDDVAQEVWVYDSWFGNDPEAAVDDRVGGGNGRAISYEVFDSYWQQFNRTYIPIYIDGLTAEVATIIGPQMDDAVMWQMSLENVQAELAQDQENGHLWFTLGTVHNALGDYETAATAFDKAREVGLPWRKLWYQFGPYEAYYQVGRYEDVIELADITLNQRPYFEESYYYRGLAYQALGDMRAARNNFADAAAFNPNYQAAAEALASLDS